MSDILMIPNYNKIIHYPKILAKAELVGSQRNINYENNEQLPEYLRKITQINQENFSKTYFEYFGAYPYLFEAIAYGLTTTDKEVLQKRLKLIEDGLFFEMRISWETLKDWALDGIKGQTENLLQTLHDVATNPQGKVIPISPTQTVVTTPLRVTLVNKNGFEMSEKEQENLLTLMKSSKLKDRALMPIKGVYIQCFTPFFRALLEEKKNGAWFPIPKAFYAKMIETQKRYKDDEELKKLNVKAYPATYRKIFLYMFMHDNNIGHQLNFNCIDLWKCVSPQELMYTKDSQGNEKIYLRRKEKARAVIYKANLLLNRMAKLNFLTGVQFAPNKVFCDYEKLTYTVFLKRVPADLKNYNQIEMMKIDDIKEIEAKNQAKDQDSPI